MMSSFCCVNDLFKSDSSLFPEIRTILVELSEPGPVEFLKCSFPLHGVVDID